MVMSFKPGVYPNGESHCYRRRSQSLLKKAREASLEEWAGVELAGGDPELQVELWGQQDC